MGDTSLGDPQSMNLFAYTRNNPVDFTDPTGLNLNAPGGGATCYLDGFLVSCATALGLVGSGAAEISGSSGGGSYGGGTVVCQPDHWDPSTTTLTAGQCTVYGLTAGSDNISESISGQEIADDDFELLKAKLLGRAFLDAFYLLNRVSECAEYVKDNNLARNAGDPAKVLEGLYRGKDPRIRVSDNNLFKSGKNGTNEAVARTVPNSAGQPKRIELALSFFSDSYFKRYGRTGRKGRIEVLIHELKHWFGGDDHNKDGSQRDYFENIKKKCLSKFDKVLGGPK